MMIDILLIAALLLWGVIVCWAIADAAKEENRVRTNHGRRLRMEREKIMESYRDHERR
jgi:hypothetical protein